jgi:hypothetical protein
VKGSETFADLFQLPQREDSAEGSTAENLIVLPVSHVDFRHFLKLVYPPPVNKIYYNFKKVSNLWYFWDLRLMALSELEENNFGHLSALGHQI